MLDICYLESDKPKELDIEYYFYLNIKVMSLIGLRCNGLTITGFVHKIPTYVANTLGVIYLMSEIYFISDPVLSRDIGLIIQTVSQSVSNIQCFTKVLLVICLNNFNFYVVSQINIDYKI